MDSAVQVGAKNVLTVALLAFILFDGYRRRGTGFFKWPMFTNHCAVVADLEVEKASREMVAVHMFHHLASHAPWITPREFDTLLEYLSQSGSVRGTGTFYGNTKTYDLEIVDSRVDIKRVRAQFQHVDE